VFDIKIVPSDHAQSDEYENRYLQELQQERKVKEESLEFAYPFRLINRN
jgi:hypothetical protein